MFLLQKLSNHFLHHTVGDRCIPSSKLLNHRRGTYNDYWSKYVFGSFKRFEKNSGKVKLWGLVRVANDDDNCPVNKLNQMINGRRGEEINDVSGKMWV